MTDRALNLNMLFVIHKDEPLFAGNCMHFKKTPLYRLLSRIYSVLALLEFLFSFYRNNKNGTETCLTGFLLSNNDNAV